MDLWKLLGNFHPKLVQFPLVLLLCGLLFDVIGLIRRSGRFHWAALLISASGTVTLLLAFICGIYAEIWAGRAGVPQDAIEWHEFLANIASWGFVVLMAWRLFLDPHSRRALLSYTIVGLSWYILLALTGYYGGQLVFSYGAAVIGAQANTVLSIHDLNTLATRQTDLNLRYSEMMHHIFGWLTLALSASLLVQATASKRAEKLRWVGPLLLLGGGIFLFFCADLDLYRLTDLRQLRDREVQLHKTIAIVLMVAGWMGLKRPAPKPGGGSPRSASRKHNQSRLVAVLALVGGGLLFTHVHTVAPYANVAAGVYIAHMVMGTIALSIGASRLLEDAVPKHRRTFATLFAVLMCVESILLITYNEGLPWYVGFGRYNRWGPHGGTVAPYGSIRAELTFDNDSQMLDVYVLNRFEDEAQAVPTSQVELLIDQGYHETSTVLRAADGDTPTSSHFRAHAPWLRDVAYLSARMALPVNGSNRIGYFDPWVTPMIHAVPPNEVAKFQCPMHDGIVSEQSGNCPICGMQLVPIQIGPRLQLHDNEFGMRMSADVAGTDVLDRRLTFWPQQNGQMLRDLPIVHEHPLHLTIVSSDLAYFDHVHPIPQSDGSLQLKYHFPQTGSFLLFAEYTPIGQRNQVFRFPVNVGDLKTAIDPILPVSDATAKTLATDPEMTAEMVPQPRTLTAGTHSMLLFHLSRQGQPVTDLEPYMGTLGHCAIISEDTQTFLHCHPEQLFPPRGDARGGPTVAFHAMFPKPGKYKVWGQFQRNGKVEIADFVVDVKESVLPPKVVNFILNDY